jgi:hypothetical protein
MSFAFGLVVFGTALAVGLRAYLAAAVSEEQDIRNRIALESAAAGVLGEIASGASSPLTGQRMIGTRNVTVELSRTAAKLDLVADDERLLERALADLGLLRAATGSWRGARSLTELSARLKLDAAGEDCLRRGFTYGRAPAPLYREAQTESPSGQAVAGDQWDVRASLVGRSGGDLLWVRARLTGGATGWALHDYRRLHGRASARQPGNGRFVTAESMAKSPQATLSCPRT